MTTPDNSLSHERHDDADPMVDALLVEFVPGDPSKRKCPPDLAVEIASQLDAPTNSPLAKKHDDADPMIDALLAEFVPSDPSNRRSPPDLSAKIFARLAELRSHRAAEKTDDADPVIDALLTEFISIDSNKRKCPPDLSALILAQLDAPTTKQTVSRSLPGETAVESWSAARSLSLVATIAACLVGVIWLSGNGADPNDQTGTGSDSPLIAKADTQDDSSSILDIIGSPETDGSNFAQDLASTGNDSSGVDRREPVQGISLESPSLAMDSDRQPINRPEPNRNADTTTHAAPLIFVASNTSATAREYWKTLGITPTADATASDVASRLKDRLGVVFSETALADPQRLRDVLAQSSNSTEIAKRWLASTTRNSLGEIARPENSDLVQELARGVAGKSPFDVTLVSLIDGSSDHSSRWYETIAHSGTEGIAKQLASVSMNADLRCVKCHDSRIGRSGTQDDYWSFVALVRNVFQRTDNRWVVSNQLKPKATFFELADGRQRLAQAKVSKHLLQSTTTIDDFQTWTKTLLGNRALAGSVVDSLWKLVHGRKLKPSPVDAFAPPVDGSLDRLHAQLAQDLVDSQFDVARTLALIISSPMATRSVPEALRDDAILTATDKQRSDALELVAAFAASVNTPRSSQKQRVDVAMRRVGGRLNTGNQGTLLAQPIYETPPVSKDHSQSAGGTPVVNFAEQLGVDFPASDSTLPVSWLRSIDNFDQRIQHLVYLSGRHKVSAEIQDAAERLKEASGEQSALSRIWWILRN